MKRGRSGSVYEGARGGQRGRHVEKENYDEGITNKDSKKDEQQVKSAIEQLEEKEVTSAISWPMPSLAEGGEDEGDRGLYEQRNRLGCGGVRMRMSRDSLRWTMTRMIGRPAMISCNIVRFRYGPLRARPRRVWRNMVSLDEPQLRRWLCREVNDSQALFPTALRHLKRNAR